MKRLARIWALVMAFCFCLILPVRADIQSPRAVFAAEEPDDLGVFSVTLTVYDAVFNVFQFALHYDSAVVQPVCKNGTTASEFSDFAEKADDTDWMATIGTVLNTDSGLIKFAGYVRPGAGDSCVSEGNAVASADGMALFTFQFKVLKKGETGFHLATATSGDSYDESLPSGAALARAGYALGLTVAFELPDSLTSGSNGDTSTTVGEMQSLQSTTPIVTKEELLNSSILLQIGNHAAVVKNGVMAIYTGESAIMPYIKQGRTYLPIRFVAEELGAVVTYEKNTRSVLIQKGADSIRMYIGQTEYTVNGVQHTMDAAPEFMNSYAAGGVRTMVPIRFVAEALGMQVEWTGCDNLVLLSPTYEWDLNGTTELEALKGASALLLQYSKFIT